MAVALVGLLLFAPRQEVELDPSLTSGRRTTTGVPAEVPEPTASEPTSTTSATTGTPSTTAIATTRAGRLDETSTTAARATVPVPSRIDGDRPRDAEENAIGVLRSTTVILGTHADRQRVAVVGPTTMITREASPVTVPREPEAEPAPSPSEPEVAPPPPPAATTPSTAPSTTAPPWTTPSTTTPPSPCGGDVFGLAGGSVLWNERETSAFAVATGATPDLVVGYASLTGPVPVDGLRRAVAAGRTAVVTLEPYGLGDDPIEAILRGDADAELARWAEELAAVDGPVAVRFAHEMNGFWYPWGRTTAEPERFAAAFRLVAEVLSPPGSAVSMMWSPNVVYPGADPLSRWWPGADVVDVIGLSGYAELSSVADAATLFGPTIDELVELAPGTGIVLAEVAAADRPERPAWIAGLFTDVVDRPEVIGLAWFDVDKERSWAITPTPDAAGVFGTLSDERRC